MKDVLRKEQMVNNVVEDVKILIIFIAEPMRKEDHMVKLK